VVAQPANTTRAAANVSIFLIVTTLNRDLAKGRIAYDMSITFLLDKGTPKHRHGYSL
jgi:hypothetical protein